MIPEMKLVKRAMSSTDQTAEGGSVEEQLKEYFWHRADILPNSLGNRNRGSCEQGSINDVHFLKVWENVTLLVKRLALPF